MSPTRPIALTEATISMVGIEVLSLRLNSKREERPVNNLSFDPRG